MFDNVIAFRNNSNIVSMGDYSYYKEHDNDVLLYNIDGQVTFAFKDGMKDIHGRVRVFKNTYKEIVECIFNFLMDSKPFTIDVGSACTIMVKRKGSLINLTFIINNREYSFLVNDVGFMKFANIGFLDEEDDVEETMTAEL